MEKLPIPENEVLEKANNSIDNLSVLLQFVDTCFKYLQLERLGPLRYELTYDYGSEREHASIKEICEDLKSSVKRQYYNSNEIDGSVYIRFYQQVVTNSIKLEVSYTGILRIFSKTCFIRLLRHSNSGEIRIDISRHLPSEEVVNTYVHLQEAILDQLNRLSNEQK